MRFVTQNTDPHLGSWNMLQIFYRHTRDVQSFGLITMRFVTQNTDPHLGSWDMLQSNSSRESLVLLWIVILQSNLELNSFQEVSLFLSGSIQDCFYTFI